MAWRPSRRSCLTPLSNSPSDTATITLNGVTPSSDAAHAANDGNGGAINGARFETVNLVSSDLPATASGSLVGGDDTADATGSGLLVNTDGTVNITGSKDLPLSVTTVNPAARGAVVYASTFNGKLAVTGSASVVNDIITG